jgi:hypothetical protein
MDDMAIDDVVEVSLNVIEGLEQLKVFRFSRKTFRGFRSNFVQGEISLLEKLESLPKLEDLALRGFRLCTNGISASFARCAFMIVVQ